MSNDHTHDHQEVRDGVGHSKVLLSPVEPAEGVDEEALPEVGLAAYRVVRYSPLAMPVSFRALILSRWKRSLRYGNDYFRLIQPNAYYRAYDAYLGRLLGDPRVAIRLAVLDEDPDVVLGFSVCRGSVLDYVHVHAHQRRLGIGRSLVPPGIDTISHLTKTGLLLWSNKCPSWAFNPFA